MATIVLRVSADAADDIALWLEFHDRLILQSTAGQGIRRLIMRENITIQYEIGETDGAQSSEEVSSLWPEHKRPRAVRKLSIFRGARSLQKGSRLRPKMGMV